MYVKIWNICLFSSSWQCFLESADDSNKLDKSWSIDGEGFFSDIVNIIARYRLIGSTGVRNWQIRNGSVNKLKFLSKTHILLSYNITVWIYWRELY